MGSVVLDYIQSLGASSIPQLYGNVCTCVAVLRCLPPLSRQILMRLAFVDQPVDISSWVSPVDGGAIKLRDALAAMARVGIIEEEAGMVKISDVYREQLLVSLRERDTSPWKQGRMGGGDSGETSVQGLRRFAVCRWESVLHYMVAPTHDAATRPEPGWTPNRQVKQVLLGESARRGELMREDRGDGEGPKITACGFQFLLKPLGAQVWQLLMDVIEVGCRDGSTTPDHLLVCLFNLSFCIVGNAYSVDHLSPQQLKFVQLLGQLGAVYLETPSSRMFWPTQLVVNLCSEGQAHSSEAARGEGQSGGRGEESDVSMPDRSSGEGKCIIVETNYRLYAYTQSALQEQVIRLFSQPLYKLPHMIICIITRSTVRNALLKGITAAQIIEYLTLHAHPQSSIKLPIVPEVVSDQIIFWERERTRITAEPAVAFFDFSRQENLSLTSKEAQEQGVLEYSNDNEGVIVVGEEASGKIRSFIETHITE